MKILYSLSVMLLWGSMLMAQAPAPAPAELQSWQNKAYRLMDEGKLAEAVEPLQKYVNAMPGDASTAVVLASLFSQLNRHQDAVSLLEQVHEQHPRQEAAYFKLGVAYVALERFENAETVFSTLVDSSNPEMAEAASVSLRQVRSQTERAERLAAQDRVFALAEAKRHEEVLEAIDVIEERWGLVYPLEMQRLYALYDTEKYEVVARLADALAGEHPNTADLDFLRAEVYMKLDRPEEAQTIWKTIEQQHAGTLTALEAQRRYRATLVPEPKAPGDEDRFFALARDEKHEEVVAGIDELEKTKGELSWMMEMQRLYSLHALGRNDRAWELSEKLTLDNPESADLSFVRAEILMRQGRNDEAIALWQQIVKDHQGTPMEAEARRRLAVVVPPPVEPVLPPEPNPEDPIYDLAREGRHAEVVKAIDELETRNGSVSWMMQMQRLYALQNLGETSRAASLSDQMRQERPDDPALALMRVDLLLKDGRSREAALLLETLTSEDADPQTRKQAQMRLSGLPPIYNLSKNYWGEAYFSGSYQGRFGDVVGYGLIRQGAFIPKVRWLQPYAEFRFSVDTDSGNGRNQTIFFDNFVGFYGGVRAQLMPEEYLFAYAQGGTSQDLLDNRDDGDWAYDYQAGIYGFKGWGPGLNFQISPSHDQGFHYQDAKDSSNVSGDLVNTNGFFWRPDWFVDAGADFSYYHRYASWIGYAQSHQGYRLFQVGPRLAFDGYLVENLSWDVKGNYFDNFASFGPGVRWVWFPCQNAQVVLRTDYLFGYYYGRDDQNNRGGASGQFNGVEIGLSVGLKW